MGAFAGASIHVERIAKGHLIDPFIMKELDYVGDRLFISAFKETVFFPSMGDPKDIAHGDSTASSP